ncbi:MAG: histidine kinase dimerization/phospho-acceptor domain-containing protein [bacterium]|nr:histidine kinase dimerization/phospho-acceptor domain-containing protein [bacterium]
MIFFISSIIIYFFSLRLAYLTTKPIKETNQKLIDYNHNLAHELKTPLAIIKTNLELLDISYDKDLVKSSFEEISSMENIISSLLFLAENSKNTLKDKVSFKDLFDKYSFDKNISICFKNDFIIY